MTALNGGFEEDTDNPSGGGPPYPNGIVDLSGFAGQTVRIKFVWSIPEPGTGFGFFQLDNVRINAAPNPNAPTVSVTAPADGSSSSQGDSVTFSGTANDTEDGDLTASLSWTSSLDGAIGSGASFSTSALSAGTHAITASVTDLGGLSGSDMITVTVNEPNTAPTAAITAPANGSSFTEGDLISFTGNASDTEDGDLSASLSWTSSLDGAIGSGGGFSAVLSVGTHTITASVTDSHGASGSDVIAVTVTVYIPPQTATLVVVDGYDQKNAKTLVEDGKLYLLLSSDNDRWETESSFYTSYEFSDLSLPAGAVITSAGIYVEHYEESDYQNGNLEWNIGTGWPDAPDVWATNSEVPVHSPESNEAVDIWNVTSLVTVDNLNALQLQVKNKDNNKKTKVDYIYAEVTFTTGPP